MAFHVVDAERGHSPRPGEAPAERGADQQRPDQPRPRGIGHAADVAGLRVRFREDAPRQRRQPPDVVARGQFRHHAAEFGVNGALRMHGVREQAARGIVDRDAGLVAGGLDPEDAHPPAAVRTGRSILPVRLARHSG